MKQDMLPLGAKGWFLKSMRRIEVIERQSDGTYTVRALDGSKQMTATRAGIALDSEVSVVDGDVLNAHDVGGADAR